METDGAAELGDLLHGAFRQLRRSWSEQLAPFGITPHQWRALNTLRQQDTTAFRLRDLADRLRIAPRSATEVVDQLEERGLVERSADATDRRAVLITLTDDGLDLVDKIRAARRVRADAFFAELTADEQRDLAALLGRLTDRD